MPDLLAANSIKESGALTYQEGLAMAEEIEEKSGKATELLEAGKEAKIPVVSWLCNLALVVLNLASKSKRTKNALDILKWIVLYPFLVPLLAAVLLIVLARFWEPGANFYNSIIREGFGFRISADEAVFADHATLDYYQLLSIGNPSMSRRAPRDDEYLILLAHRQKARITFYSVRPEYISDPGCAKDLVSYMDTPIFVFTLGGQKLRDLKFGGETHRVILDSDWWNANEIAIGGMGFEKSGDQYALPLSAKLTNEAMKMAGGGGEGGTQAPCLFFTSLVAIEVYKQKYAAERK